MLEKIFRCRYFITESKSLTFIGTFIISCYEVKNVANVLNRSAHPLPHFRGFEIRMPRPISMEVTSQK